jgi:hypothetical protein
METGEGGREEGKGESLTLHLALGGEEGRVGVTRACEDRISGDGR